MDNTATAPGIYVEKQFEQPLEALRTAVPLLLGYVAVDSGQAGPGSWPAVERFTLADEFTRFLMKHKLHCESYLSQAVRGFFENGGQACYVAAMTCDSKTPAATLEAKLATSAAFPEIDLVCAPDIMTHLPDAVSDPTGFVDGDIATVVEMQRVILEHCDCMGDRFAILDAIGAPGPVKPADSSKSPDAVTKQREALSGVNGALYFPWVRVRTSNHTGNRFMPPCGHVAGVYARTDQRSGVYKAPANEVLEGVTDLQYPLGNAEQGPLNAAGVNCLRAFPGRGIRVWGARTLSADPAWTYVNVRRLFLTAGRWIERTLAAVVFEPNDARLWAQIRRELTVYCADLWRRGALKGRSAEEAFYVKCDAETNPEETRAAGAVITEIGLAPAVPGEFVIVRILQSAGGIRLAGPTPAESR